MTYKLLEDTTTLHDFLENTHTHNLESIQRSLAKDEWHWLIPEEIEDTIVTRSTLRAMIELHLEVHEYL